MKLQDRITDLAFASHFDLKGIYVFDNTNSGKFSHKVLLAGYGDRKRIILSDSLLFDEEKAIVTFTT